jgi:hypothetical protein
MQTAEVERRQLMKEMGAFNMAFHDLSSARTGGVRHCEWRCTLCLDVACEWPESDTGATRGTGQWRPVCGSLRARPGRRPARGADGAETLGKTRDGMEWDQDQTSARQPLLRLDAEWWARQVTFGATISE